MRKSRPLLSRVGSHGMASLGSGSFSGTESKHTRTGSPARPIARSPSPGTTNTLSMRCLETSPGEMLSRNSIAPPWASPAPVGFSDLTIAVSTHPNVPTISRRPCIRAQKAAQAMTPPMNAETMTVSQIKLERFFNGMPPLTLGRIHRIPSSTSFPARVVYAELTQSPVLWHLGPSGRSRGAGGYADRRVDAVRVA
jgi:hypothetical protein